MPSRLTVIEPTVVELLRQGLPNTDVAKAAGMSTGSVALRRKRLGIPPHPRRRKVAPSLQAAFEARTAPTTDGHLTWTGGLSNKGTPIFSHLDKPYWAYAVAFWIHNGRWPTGQSGPDCGVRQCVAPAHIEDEVTRRRNRAVYAALTGRRPRGDRCRRGHLSAEHAKFRPNGRRYCATCQEERRLAALS